VFDSRPGPVRDTLAGHQRDWRGLIAAEVQHGDPARTALQLDAILMAANTALRLDDHATVRTVHTIIDDLLGQTSGRSTS